MAALQLSKRDRSSVLNSGETRYDRSHGITEGMYPKERLRNVEKRNS